MIPYVTCRVPLRVSAPTVIPVCDHWNRGKTEVLSTQDGRVHADTGANQYQTATAADNQHANYMQTSPLVSEMLCMGVQASSIPESFSWLNHCTSFTRRGELISPISFSWVTNISHTHMGSAGIYSYLPEF